MEIKKTTKISMTENDVKKAVVEYVKTKMGYDVTEKDVYFRLGRHLEGYGMDEYENITFDECTINCPEKE